MKRILTYLVLFAAILSNSISFAQTTHPVELGFNLGASWLQSDVKMKKLGGAGGFTLGQMYLQNDKSGLDWGWRFRYLNALAYGQDNKKSTGIANNPALNGFNNGNTNYNTNGGFVYQNHKTTINELSLELVIGANRMRNKTKVYPYIFGGLGITKAVTKTNQQDGSGFLYDYASIDSNGTANASQITSSLNTMYDGSYETFAEGSEVARWKFMPSLGVGLGYQFSPGFSMGLEHKMTWALHDGLDGQQWNNDNTVSGTKDKYHYSSVWLKFSFGRKVKPVATTTTTTNIVTPTAEKPTVVITNPSVNSFTSTSQSFTVKATIKNVNSKSDIVLKYNGINNSNFTYDVNTKQFAFPLMLLNGSNTFEITATNASGNATDNATVLYETQVVVPPSPAPIVTITSPTANPFSTTMNNAMVVASVFNVTSPSQIGVTINGIATGSFTFNPSTHVMTVSSNLNPGANTFVISATNAVGSDSKSVTIIYSVANVTPPPFITIVNPAVNPFTSNVSNLPINAIVQNVTSVGQISVTTTTGIVPTSMLSFNPSTGQLNFNANLIAGANAVTISATNVAGADSKSITIIYNQPVVSNPPPVVTFINPSVNPFSSSVASLPINALVQNVTAIGQISVTTTAGIVPTSMLSFNPSTGQLNFNANLVSGANAVTISATNVAGADSKSITVIYNQPVATSPAPVVTITSPTVNPFNTTTNVTTVNAIVLNVTTPSQISVLINGVSTSAFSYNVTTKQFTLTANLIAGANIVSVTASNASGSDSKSQTIIYTQPVAVQKPVVTITVPNVNPSNTSTAVNPITATVLNVISSAQIAVSINGVATSTFAYNVTTKQLTLSPTLIVGANIVTVTATTAAGSDSKSQTIIYTPPPAAAAPEVTITSPNVNPYNTSTTPVTVSGSVVNVTSSSQIVATLNGVSAVFAYNLITKQLTMAPAFISGANVITITATTPAGSDSKSTTIIYTPPVVTGPAPVVTITYPTVNPLNITIATSTVYATVLNVASSSEITATINGGTVPFVYNGTTKQLTITASLVAGANVVTIKAATASGTDTKSTTIVYTAPVVVPAPVVTFTRPIAPGGVSTTAVYNVEATVTNMSSSSGITVKVNGVAITAFTYTAGTNQLKFNANLVLGTNTVTVTATNASGTDTKSVMITYKKNIDPLSPDSTNTPGVGRPKGTPIGTGTSTGTPAAGSPTITFGLPNPYSSSTPVVNVTAVVNGIAIQTDAVVKVNGVAVTFVYTVKTKTISFTANVNVGPNTITITATNPSGARTETLIVNR